MLIFDDVTQQTDLWSVDEDSKKLYHHDGFSDIIIEEFDLDFAPLDITYDGSNIVITSYDNRYPALPFDVSININVMIGKSGDRLTRFYSAQGLYYGISNQNLTNNLLSIQSYPTGLTAIQYLWEEWNVQIHKGLSL